jgi:8-oxo-dGTP diphosphatase
MMGILLKIWKKLGLSKSLQLRILRFLNNQFLIGVTGIIFNDKNEVLLFKHTYRQIAWSLPGGYMKGKEHPKEALEREIKEESGFTVSIDWRMKVRTDRDTARIDMPYIGTYIGGKFTASNEVSDFGFFDFKNLPLIRNDQLYLIETALEQRKAFFSNPYPNTRFSKRTEKIKREIARL